jgi:hypothetical protein
VAGQGLDVRFEDGVRRERAARRETLEIEAWDDLSFVAAAIAEEAGRWRAGRLGRSRARHRPVDWAGDRLRIGWRDAAVRLSPTPAQARAALGRWYVMAEELASDLAAIDGLPLADQERRIAEMARAGQAVTAVALARELWGLNLTEARQRIASLDSRPPAA